MNNTHTNYLNYLKSEGKSNKGVDKSILESKLFYDNDVVARRLRERKEISNAEYNSNIQIGDKDTWEHPTYFAEYDATNRLTNINPYFAEDANNDEVSLKLLSRILAHELAHADETSKPGIDSTYDRGHLYDITQKESKLLNDAYKGETNNANKLVEKHAFNRELREDVYRLFINLKNREPKNIEELDSFIKHDLKNSDLLELMKKGSKLGFEYIDSIKSGKSSIKKVKNALIKVAQNDTKKDSDIESAKFGGIINYLQYTK